MSAPPPTDPTWPQFARSVISNAVRETAAPRIPPPADAGRAHSGAFVTLRKAERLRGCMGTLDPSMTLVEAVRHAAVNAALHDPRFPPLRPEELHDVTVEVSVLSEPHAMQSLDDLVLGRHGIIVEAGHRRGLFLPQVATDHNLDKIAFLSRCCSEKAGLAADAWRQPDTSVQIFEAEKFSE